MVVANVVVANVVVANVVVVNVVVVANVARVALRGKMMGLQRR